MAEKIICYTDSNEAHIVGDLIRCGDCKYFLQREDRNLCGNMDSMISPGPTDFCSRAEGKTKYTGGA